MAVVFRNSFPNLSTEQESEASAAWELDEKPIAARCTCLLLAAGKEGRHQKDDLD